MTDTQAHTRQAGDSGHRCMQTSCGRTLDVGTMMLGDERQAVGRVTMRLGQCPQCGDGTWAALSPNEARRLGLALLAQAAVADAREAPAGAGRVEVTAVGGDSYQIMARGHELLVDQPVADGGLDAAATPTELMVGALASCVAFYAGRYLRRHQLDPSGLRVRAEFEMAADRPARIGEVRLAIFVPSGVPEDRRQALLAVASHCTVHNTLRQPPAVAITLD